MSDTCIAPGCDREIQIKYVRMCSAHYQQQRDGRPLSVPRVSSLVRDEHGHKRCRTCRKWLPEEAFGLSSRSLDRRSTYCRTCIRRKQRSVLGQQRDRSRERRFNMNRAQFDEMLQSQGGRCAICGTSDPGKYFWCVDHDHDCCPESGVSCGDCVRGILCAACNKAIGLLGDRAETVERAVAYLSRRPASMSVVRGV